VTIGFLNVMLGEVLEVITTIEIFHANRKQEIAGIK
jgi:hypothetical protein